MRYTFQNDFSKIEKVAKASAKAFRINRCDGCFFQGGRLVKDGYVEDCATFLFCNGIDRKDKTYVVFEEVEE